MVDPVARLSNDVQIIITKRRIESQDAESLREAVREVNACDEGEPVEFDWDTEMYKYVCEFLHRQSRRVHEEAEARELEDAQNNHQLGDVWAVRSEFTEVNGWKKKKREDLELYWLVTLIGRAYRNAEGAIRIPVRYFEADLVKTKDRTKEQARTSQYKIGSIKTDLTVRDLQLKVRLNNKTKAGFQKINFNDRRKLGHLATRSLENAKGHYDVSSDEDD